eukprot:1143870-Prorocentrum_minimum.AAC.3
MQDPLLGPKRGQIDPDRKMIDLDGFVSSAHWCLLEPYGTGVRVSGGRGHHQRARLGRAPHGH